MFMIINGLGLLSGLITPKDEDQSSPVLIQQHNNSIRQLFPAAILVRTWFIFLDTEYRIEEKDALLG